MTLILEGAALRYSIGENVHVSRVSSNFTTFDFAHSAAGVTLKAMHQQSSHSKLRAVSIRTGRNMKILWVSHLVPFPPKAGVLIRSYNLIRELGERHSVDLLMLNQPRLLNTYFDSQQEGLDTARTELSGFIDRIELAPIESEATTLTRMKLAASALVSRRSFTSNWLKGREIIRRYKEMVNSGRYDLIHFDTISLDFLREHSPDGIPLAMDHHNIESHMMLRRAEKEPNYLKSLYFSIEYKKLFREEKTAVKKYATNIVCSAEDEKHLLRMAPDATTRIVPNGIRLSQTIPKRNIKKGKLLFIGGLSWYPNEAAIRDFLDHIAPLLREQNVDFHLDVIGKNPPADLLEQTREHADIEFHGFVDDIKVFYEQANIYVCPINDGGGTKLKVLDAMAHCAPLVAYPLACEGIDVTDGTEVLLANSHEQFCDHIVTLLDDTDLALQLGKAGRALIERSYAFDRIGETLAAHYSEVANTNKSHTK